MRRCLSQHRKMWIIAGWQSQQAVYWCWECGAIRLYPEDKKWTYPVGPTGENPAMRLTEPEGAVR